VNVVDSPFALASGRFGLGLGWSHVKAPTIANCYRAAGFVDNTDELIDDEGFAGFEDEDMEAQGYFDNLRDYLDIPDDVTFLDYVSADNNLELRSH